VKVSIRLAVGGRDPVMIRVQGTLCHGLSGGPARKSLA
jgi:hypothetical protein